MHLCVNTPPKKAQSVSILNLAKNLKHIKKYMKKWYEEQFEINTTAVG